MSREQSRTVNIGTDLGEAMHADAEALDMSTAVFVRAVLAGARHRGITTSLALQAIEKGLVPNPKRRMRTALPWESDGENWHYGPWTMVRKGVIGRYPKPGDGWYLEGPGLEGEPLYFGKDKMRQEAFDAANDHITMLAEKEAAEAAEG